MRSWWGCFRGGALDGGRSLPGSAAGSRCGAQLGRRLGFRPRRASRQAAKANSRRSGARRPLVEAFILLGWIEPWARGRRASARFAGFEPSARPARPAGSHEAIPPRVCALGARVAGGGVRGLPCGLRFTPRGPSFYFAWPFVSLRVDLRSTSRGPSFHSMSTRTGFETRCGWNRVSAAQSELWPMNGMKLAAGAVRPAVARPAGSRKPSEPGNSGGPGLASM